MNIETHPDRKVKIINKGSHKTQTTTLKGRLTNQEVCVGGTIMLMLVNQVFKFVSFKLISISLHSTKLIVISILKRKYRTYQVQVGTKSD